jgi:hypothetical protein
VKRTTGWKIERLLLALALLLAQAACASPDPEAQAWHACTLFVQNRTGLPASDAQPYDPARVTELVPDRHRVTVYYAKANGFYRCEILHRADDNWQLLRLDFVHWRAGAFFPPMHLLSCLIPAAESI